jgi:hypothetical protein
MLPMCGPVVGDVIITRANDRRLRLTRHRLGQNGDRWTITQLGKQGDLPVRHNRSQLTVRLPVDYVRTSTARLLPGLGVDHRSWRVEDPAAGSCGRHSGRSTTRASTPNSARGSNTLSPPIRSIRCSSTTWPAAKA